MTMIKDINYVKRTPQLRIIRNNATLFNTTPLGLSHDIEKIESEIETTKKPDNETVIETQKKRYY